MPANTARTLARRSELQTIKGRPTFGKFKWRQCLGVDCNEKLFTDSSHRFCAKCKRKLERGRERYKVIFNKKEND